MAVRFQPGCSCCEKTGCRIGYEQYEWLNPRYCLCPDSKGVQTDLSVGMNITTKLSKCDFVFCGCDNCCTGTYFTSFHYSYLADWINEGGRLYVSGEYNGCMWPYGFTTINELLEGIGSELRVREGIVDCTCGNIDGPWIMAPGSAGIAQGIDITYACTGYVDGGTTVGYRRDVQEQIFALEQLGDGIVLVGCDSNILGSALCGYNCDFLERWYTWATEEIV
jgi:hypothetical protein